MSRVIKFAPKEFYHLYNRGTEKRDIFISHSDYERFKALMYICNQPGMVDLRVQGKTLFELKKIRKDQLLINISAYCLMPNHIHILAQELNNNGISKFMQKIMTGYTMYFNKKHERTGALFQGKFKATHANDDRYLAYLISYVHLNPIKLVEPRWKETGIVDFKKTEKYLDHYQYSSYLDYLGQDRVEKILLNKTSLPTYFHSNQDFQKSVTNWMTYQHDKSKII